MFLLLRFQIQTINQQSINPSIKHKTMTSLARKHNILPVAQQLNILMLSSQCQTSALALPFSSPFERDASSQTATSTFEMNRFDLHRQQQMKSISEFSIMHSNFPSFAAAPLLMPQVINRAVIVDPSENTNDAQTIVWRADSVRRKRKHKMNKHKHRKRLKLNRHRR